MTLRVEFWSSCSPESLEDILEGLVRQNVRQLERARARGIAVPRLYDSTAVYRRDPPGREMFRSIARVLRSMASWCGDRTCPRCCAPYGELDGPALRWFDCDDGACAVAAEHRFYHRRGSRAKVIETKTAGLLHAVTELPNGQIEDPTTIVRSMRR